MPHHVYANDNEIASKSANGSSIACFPDVCISPGPPPPPGGIPVPYPNSCFARDLTRISKTVFIKRKGAALENHSYFKTSFGDEPATPALKKGVVTSTIKGKCYFQSWSMNVKIEGKGVARHMDTVSHNHTNTANAHVQKYMSIFNNSKACSGDRNAIKKHCKPKKEKKKKGVKRKKSLFKTLGNVLTFPDEMARKAYGYNKPNMKNSWIDDYCDGLWIKPTNRSKEFKKAKEQLNELLEIAQSKTAIMQRALDEIFELAKGNVSTWFLVKQGLKLGGKALVKNIIGGAAGATGVGLVVTAGMATWTVSDVIKTATTIAEKVGPEAMEHLKDLTDMDKLQKMAKDKLQEYKDDPMKAMADAQSAKAKLSPCLKARKCQLFPYSRTSTARKQAKSGNACCPGQTGHHIMPDAMIKGRPCYESKGGRGAAPTMCMEGADNSHGSHGRTHKKLYRSMEEYRTKNNTDKISYEDAKKKALDALPFTGCSRPCLEAQLDSFYSKCKTAKLDAIAGSNKDDTLSPPSTGGGGSLGG